MKKILDQIAIILFNIYFPDMMLIKITASYIYPNKNLLPIKASDNQFNDFSFQFWFFFLKLLQNTGTFNINKYECQLIQCKKSALSFFSFFFVSINK